MYRHSALTSLKCTPIDISFTKIRHFDEDVSGTTEDLRKSLRSLRNSYNKRLILLFTDKQTVNKANKASKCDPSSYYWLLHPKAACLSQKGDTIPDIRINK